jgi:hypothetical protein
MPDIKRFKCGTFVTPIGKYHPRDVALVCVDHAVLGYGDFYTVRWLSNGDISNRKHEELFEVDAETATKIWCRECIEFETK